MQFTGPLIGILRLYDATNSTSTDMLVNILNKFSPEQEAPIRRMMLVVISVLSLIQYLVKKMVASASVVWGWRASWTYFKS